MKIFLIYPQIDVSLSYNYGLGYIASVLKVGGHTVDYVMLKNREDSLELYKKIQKQRPEIIGFSVMTSQANYVGDVVKTIKKNSHVFIVCGGIHPTLKPEYLSEVSGLDAIVRGEGEFPLCELADTIKEKRNYFQIKNFWFRKGEGIIKNDLRPLVDIDKLPFPDKSILDYQQLLDQSGGANRFIFSRGCFFDCPYCSNYGIIIEKL